MLLRYPLDEGIEPIPENELLQPKWILSLDKSHPAAGTEQLCNGDHGILPVNGAPSLNGALPAETGTPLSLTNGTNFNLRRLSVRVEENRRLTPASHWQDVRHLHFSTSTKADYGPGDVLTVYPQNSSEDVDQILTQLAWNEYVDQPLVFKPSGKQDSVNIYPHPPVTVERHDDPLTLRRLLIHHLDIRAIPRRSFFAIIAHFTDDQMHKERLLEFTDPKYIDELYDYTTRPRRSILEVLQEFDSVKVPWQWAATVFPELRGRQFSIASGGLGKFISEGRTSFDILVAIVKYKTVIKRLREGVCTRYLAGLPTGTELAVTLQKGGLNVQKIEARRPVIMIGPGTGVAPMRSLIWERYHWHQQRRAASQEPANVPSPGSYEVGETVLFYGGRNKEADFFYEEEWKALEEKMPLKVFTAFSRDQATKIYVQDVLKQQAELVYDLLYSKIGLVYVCGSSGKMPQAVRAILVDVFQSCGSMDEPAAEDYLQSMEKEGRYKQETW